MTTSAPRRQASVPHQRAFGAITSAMFVLASASHALAQGTVAAQADALFDDANRLFEAGRYHDACPKYAESHRLDPGVGALLKLAKCYERIGKTASAWTALQEAEALAQQKGDKKREQTAHTRAAELAPKLTRLSIVVSPAAQLVGLVVRRNGEDLGLPQWGQALPVDPGTYTIQAGAPGRKPWTTTISATEGSKTVSVAVPILEAASAPDVTSAERLGTAIPQSVGGPPAAVSPSTTARLTNSGEAFKWAIVAAGTGRWIPVGSMFGGRVGARLATNHEVTFEAARIAQYCAPFIGFFTGYTYVGRSHSVIRPYGGATLGYVVASPKTVCVLDGKPIYAASNSFIAAAVAGLRYEPIPLFGVFAELTGGYSSGSNPPLIVAAGGGFQFSIPL